MDANEVIDAPAKAADNAIAEYKPTEAALAELRQRYAAVAWDCSTTKGDKDARAVRKELVTLRTSLEGKRKALKAPALEYSRRIDSEAARIAVQIAELEEPVDAAIKAEEQRKEAERQKRAAEEAQRVDAIQRRIAEIRAIVAAPAQGSADLHLHVQLVESLAVDDSYQEFKPMAEAAKAETLQQLRRLHAAAVEREAEAARMEAERAELARLRAADEERQRTEAARAAAEARAAQEKLAEERAAFQRQRDEARAEQERLDAEAAAARRRADEEAQRHRAEADRLAREAREAEEQRLAAERAALQRQMDAAAAERRAALEAAEAEAERQAKEAASAEQRVRDAAPQMLAVLQQWQRADEANDAAALKYARAERDIAIAAALA